MIPPSPSRPQPRPSAPGPPERVGWRWRRAEAVHLEVVRRRPFAGKIASELGHDVKVPEGTGVLVKQVGPDLFERRRLGTVRAGTRSADSGHVVGLADRPAVAALRSQRREERLAVSPGEAHHRRLLCSPRGSSAWRPATPHASHPSSTKSRCAPSSSRIHPDRRQRRRRPGPPSCLTSSMVRAQTSSR